MADNIVVLPPVIVTAPAPSLADLTVTLALKEVGVHEEGKANWGPKVKEYLAAAEIDVPAAWCAAFCNWSAEHAAKSLGVKSPLEQVPLQGYVQSYVDYGKKHGWEVPVREAKRGDLLCIWHQSLNRYGHIALVTGWTKDKKLITTVEGNSNTDGSREGREVVEHERTPTSKLVILRWAK